MQLTEQRPAIVQTQLSIPGLYLTAGGGVGAFRRHFANLFFGKADHPVGADAGEGIAHCAGRGTSNHRTRSLERKNDTVVSCDCQRSSILLGAGLLVVYPSLRRAAFSEIIGWRLFEAYPVTSLNTESCSCIPAGARAFRVRPRKWVDLP